MKSLQANLWSNPAEQIRTCKRRIRNSKGEAQEVLVQKMSFVQSLLRIAHTHNPTDFLLWDVTSNLHRGLGAALGMISGCWAGKCNSKVVGEV